MLGWVSRYVATILPTERRSGADVAVGGIVADGITGAEVAVATGIGVDVDIGGTVAVEVTTRIGVADGASEVATLQ